MSLVGQCFVTFPVFERGGGGTVCWFVIFFLIEWIDELRGMFVIFSFFLVEGVNEWVWVLVYHPSCLCWKAVLERVDGWGGVLVCDLFLYLLEWIDGWGGVLVCDLFLFLLEWVDQWDGLLVCDLFLFLLEWVDG